MTHPASHSPLTPRIVLLMSVATGLIVASNYYAQPLLHIIGLEFGLSTSAAGAINTTAQLSYAAGLLFLVPLGDLFERRALIVGMTLCSAAGVALVALAPNVGIVLAGTALAGLTAVCAQIMVPFAATLAAPHERGRVVGTIMSGLLLGILLARTAAGALAGIGDWRTVYWVAAVLLVGLAAALWRALPRHPGHTVMGYGALLRSIATLMVEEPLFRARSLIGALVFAQFSVLWTSLTFLLANPPYRYSEAAIGLFGLAGAAGAIAAKRFGRLADRGYINRCTRAGLWLLLGSWAVLALGGMSLTALLAGIVVLDLAAQGLQVTNQSCIYRLRPDARSRLTAGYMTAYFLGGAFGSSASAFAYAHAGWQGVILLGAGLGVLSLSYGTLAPAARVAENGAAPTHA
ncbi:MFS transporter [Bordetella genomosp. 9]|uniref:MFS transporter n=1 Tax=Bordetella genomosp. 9 TaxID=1416803 RepID=UPI000A296C3F|nr:MFS transporter [Bordetella genomosp. 9]ARP91262.1 MFS transporter [Bordetella genomosp. 9]